MITAPRDGTEILLHTTCHGWVQAWYSPATKTETMDGPEYDGPIWVCADDAFQIEVEEAEDEMGAIQIHDNTADGWLPLPESN